MRYRVRIEARDRSLQQADATAARSSESKFEQVSCERRSNVLTAIDDALYNAQPLHKQSHCIYRTTAVERDNQKGMCQNVNCENYATTYRDVYQLRLLESRYAALGESALKAAFNTTKPSQLIEVWAMIGAQCADHPASQEVNNGGSVQSSLMGIPLKDMIKSMALEAVCRQWAGSPEEITKLLERLYQTADVSEQKLIIRVLPLLEFQEHFVRIATEAARTNIVPVFSALALGNPFPQEHFNENQWNQMVLKAIFVGCEVRKIVGLRERHNSSLSETIFQYISERHSAQRSVPRAVVELCEQALSAASLLQLNAIKSALLQE